MTPQAPPRPPRRKCTFADVAASIAWEQVPLSASDGQRDALRPLNSQLRPRGTTPEPKRARWEVAEAPAENIVSLAPNPQPASGPVGGSSLREADGDDRAEAQQTPLGASPAEQPARAASRRRAASPAAPPTPEEAAEDAAYAARCADFHEREDSLKEGLAQAEQFRDAVIATAEGLHSKLRRLKGRLISLVHGPSKPTRKRGIRLFYKKLAERARELGHYPSAIDLVVLRLCADRGLSHGASPAQVVENLRWNKRCRGLPHAPQTTRYMPAAGGAAPRQPPRAPPPGRAVQPPVRQQQQPQQKLRAGRVRPPAQRWRRMLSKLGLLPRVEDTCVEMWAATHMARPAAMAQAVRAGGVAGAANAVARAAADADDSQWS